MPTFPYLHLACVKTDRQLMRLLPPEVACRYHALPIATDGSRITVAMASPEDSAASAAVTSAIGVPICFIQADSQEIDQLLAEIWPQKPAPRLRLLLWSPTVEAAANLEPYAQSLTDLLDADLEQIDIPWRGPKSFPDLISAAEQIRPDIFIFQSQNLSQIDQFLHDKKTQKQIDKFPNLLIVPENPFWPLTKILLVLPDGIAEDESAISWTVKLARSAKSAVTVLPLLPPIPGWYGRFIQYSTQTLLAADDPLGQKMRSVADRLSEDAIEGVIKLREGEPLDQLCDEILTSDPDLVIISSSAQGSLRRWMTGDLIRSLLESIDRPVLISKDNWREKN